MAISAGATHLRTLDDGSVACWGSTPAVTGDGTNTDRARHPDGQPGRGQDGRGDLGGDVNLRTLDDGSVACWGVNSGGRLGDGTNTDRSTPTQTASLGAGRTAGGLGRRLSCLRYPRRRLRRLLGVQRRGTARRRDHYKPRHAHTDGQPRRGQDRRGDLGGPPPHLRDLDDGSVACWGPMAKAAW